MYRDPATRRAWYRKYRQRPEIRERMRNYQRAYREKNSEKVRAYQREYHNSNRIHLNALQNERRAANLEKNRKRDKIYRENNRETIREKNREWMKKWRRNHGIGPRIQPSAQKTPKAVKTKAAPPRVVAVKTQEKPPSTQKELDKIWAEKEKRDPWWVTLARRH